MKDKTVSYRRGSDHAAARTGPRLPLWGGVLCTTVLAAATGLPIAHAEAVSQSETPAACATSGRWIDVKSGRTINRGELFADLAKTAVVLLGESHTDVDHHRWQLQT